MERVRDYGEKQRKEEKERGKKDKEIRSNLVLKRIA